MVPGKLSPQLRTRPPRHYHNLHRRYSSTVALPTDAAVISAAAAAPLNFVVVSVFVAEAAAFAFAGAVNLKN